MMSVLVAEGGCMCGAIRFRAAGEPLFVGYCHCRDCRKASGAPVMVFVGFQVGQVEVSGRLALYDSSAGVRRGFCGECGTSLSYEDEKLVDETYLAIGAFDEPELFEPAVHSWDSQRLPWLHVQNDLPRYEKSGVPR